MLNFIKKRKLHRELINSHVFSLGDIYHKKSDSEWAGLGENAQVTILDFNNKRKLVKFRLNFTGFVSKYTYKQFLSNYTLIPVIESYTIAPYSIHPIKEDSMKNGCSYDG